MSFSNASARAEFSPNGSTTEFAFNFPFLDSGHIAVVLTDASGVDTEWQLNTHYTLSGAGRTSTGGTVKAITAPASGTTLVVYRSIPQNQPTTYRYNSGFPANTVEEDIDRLTQLIQEQQLQIDRSIRIPVSNETQPAMEASLSARASKFLGFDENGDFSLAEEFPLAVLPNGAAYDVENIAALKAIAVAGIPLKKQIVVGGYYAAGDGGGGVYYYDSSSVATANDGTVIAPTTGSGRWIRNESKHVSIRVFGAVGDGTTNDTAAVQACVTACRSVIIPEGTFICTDILVPSETDIIGHGKYNSILKARGTAEGNGVLLLLTGNSNIRVSGVTLDGNRDALGTAATSSGCLYIGATHVTISECEIRHGSLSGIFFGDNTTPVENLNILNCWIHDNGGAEDDTGNGVGVLGIGTATSRHISIIGNVIERNYNTVTQPNDSSGINIIARDVVISGNRFFNNYNVSGGQVAVTDGVDGSGTINAAITGNTIRLTSSFGSDITGGIEVHGRNWSISGNSIEGASGNAVIIEGASGGFGTVSGNTIIGALVGINLLGGSAVESIDISGNHIVATIGIAFDSSQPYVLITGNSLAGCTTPYQGTLNSSSFIRGNLAILDSALTIPNELRESPNTGVSITTATATNCASLSLPAGTWDVWGVIIYKPAATTNVIEHVTQVSTTSADGSLNIGRYIRTQYGTGGLVFGGRNIAEQSTVRRFTLASTTTVYLVGYAEFSVSTLTADARIFAERAY